MKRRRVERGMVGRTSSEGPRSFEPMPKPRRPIRIATLGDWGRYFSYFLYGTLEGAIMNGCWFRPLDIRLDWGRIKQNIMEFRPDILFAHMLFSSKIRPIEETLEGLYQIRELLGTKVFYHLGDARTEPRYPHDISHGVDACLVNQTGNLTKFSLQWKVPTYYWPYCCFFQRVIAEPVEEFNHDLVFTGRLGDGIHAGRTKFVKGLLPRLPVTVYPNKAYPDTKLLTAEISASAEAILGVCAGYKIEGYMDVRPFQYPGAGAFLFQRRYLGMERIFSDGQHMVIFNTDNPEEFVDLYYTWMSDSKEEERQAIRNTAFEYCQSQHTAEHRVRDVIDITFGEIENTRVLP